MEFYIFVYSPVPVQLVCEEDGFSRVLVTGILACVVAFWSWLGLMVLPGISLKIPFHKGLRSNLLQAEV